MSISALEALEKRRTIRQYDPDYQIPQEQLDKIINAAQISPTADDAQGSDFIVVRNKEKLDKMGEVTMECLSEEDINDLKYNWVRPGVKNLVTCDATTVILIVKNGNSEEQWESIDAGIASMSIMMAAQNFGIESMCLGILAMENTHEKVEQLFGLKSGSLVLGIALGKPKGEIKFREKKIKSKVSYVD